MTRYRLLLAATWTAVTVAAVLIAWLAVSSAVANVADPAPAVIGGQRSGASASLSTTSTAPATNPEAPPVSDAASADPDATNAQNVAPAADPTRENGGAGVGDPLAVERTDDAAAASSSTHTASFSNEGGVVTLSCTGDTISLLSATPRQGYTVVVGNSGPSQVEVTFKSSSHDAEIHGQCVGGKPVATVSDD